MTQAFRFLYVLPITVFLSLAAAHGQIVIPDREIQGEVGFTNSLLDTPDIAPGTIYALSVGLADPFNNQGAVFGVNPDLRQHAVVVDAFGGDYWLTTVLDVGPQQYHFGYAANSAGAPGYPNFSGVYDPVTVAAPPTPTTPITGVDLLECAGRVRVHVIEPDGAGGFRLATRPFQVNTLSANPRSDPGQAAPTFGFRSGVPNAINAGAQAFRNASTSSQPVDLFVRSSAQSGNPNLIRYQIRVDSQMSCTTVNPDCPGVTSVQGVSSYFEGATANFGTIDGQPFPQGGAASSSQGASPGIEILCDGDVDVFIVLPPDCMPACTPPPVQFGTFEGCAKMIGETATPWVPRTFIGGGGANQFNLSNTGGSPGGFSSLFGFFDPANSEGIYHTGAALDGSVRFRSFFALNPLLGVPQNFYDSRQAHDLDSPPPNGIATGADFCMVPGIYKGTVTLRDAAAGGLPTGAVGSLDGGNSVVLATLPQFGRAQRDYRGGSYNAASGVYTIPYENIIGNPDNESDTWRQQTHVQRFFNNAVAPDLFKQGSSFINFAKPTGLVAWVPSTKISVGAGGSYTGSLMSGTQIAERAARFIPVNYDLCYSRLAIQIDSTTVDFFNPRITQYTGSFNDDRATPGDPDDDMNYSLSVDSAWLGTPQTQAQAGHTGFVNLSLPQGHYADIGGFITTVLTGGGTGETQLPRITLDVGCGQTCTATPDAIVCLEPIRQCNDPDVIAGNPINVSGTLNHDHPIVSGYYKINDGAPVSLDLTAVGVTCPDHCSDAFTISVTGFVACDNAIEIGFVDDGGLAISATMRTRKDQTAPAIACPQHVVRQGGRNGAVVNYASATATDACEPDPNEACDPPSGSTFPLGDTQVICRTTDGCNDAQCSFTVTVNGCDDGVYCNGLESFDPTLGCVPGTPPDCRDSSACTDDRCDEESDSCVHTPIDASCNDGRFCNGIETCDPAHGCVPGAPPACGDPVACTIDACNFETDRCEHTPDDLSCDDHDPCTDDSCNPTSGCENVQNALCEASPRTQGFWKRLCARPHPEGSITQADADCVNDTCTFASVATVADLCARLFPDPPNDKCEQAEAQFMALMLNHCQHRVADASPILSQCTSNTTEGQSRAEADALLCAPTRGQSTCTRAQCESDEINTGMALQTNSLRLALQADGSLRLAWHAPYGVSDLGPPKAYLVRRRTSSETAYTPLASTSELWFVDAAAVAGVSYQYEVTPVW